MGDNKSYAALEWVVGEIGESLKQARQALEAYVANIEDTTRIRFCLTHIHQVHGSLQMVEFYGAALLAEEMENLAQALMNRTVKNEAEGQEVLMRAILQLPIYLDQVKHNRKDHPASVLPLLNDLRAVRGEALLTETKLFSPDMAPARQVEQKPAGAITDNQQFVTVVGKLRQMYQYAAAGLIRDVNREENSQYVSKVFARLRKLTSGSARQPLWDISLALLEGLQDSTVEFGASVKNLLRQLDKEILDLCERGITGLDIFTNDELIKNILFYIARSKGQGKHIKRIKKLYNLESALPDTASSEGEDIMAPDLEAIRSVVSAIKDELDAIKHALDVSLTDREQVDVNEALPIIKRVADTMAVLGIGDLRKQIMAQGEALEKAAEDGEVPEPLLMSVAGKIIEIENSLELMASGSSKADNLDASSPGINALDQAQESVLRESRNGLEQAKDAIIEYIASQWSQEHLANVPNHLREIGGGLDMIPLHKPAAILNSCADYIQQQLLEKELTPEWNTLDTLADAIASVEYYLERLSGDREEEDEMLLGVAEDSVKTLGYPIDTSSVISEVVTSGADEGSNAPGNIEIGAIEESNDLTGAEPGQIEVAEQTSFDDEFTVDLGSSAEEIHTENSVVDPVADPASEEVPESRALVDAGLQQQEEKSSVDEEDSLIDDEIIEIFVEEADEVIAAINEYFPKWAENFEDKESLTEFRRAFHTLKGSGRMVNANDLGELAWSIENMLNRVMDNSIEPSDTLVALINQARPILPSMVEAFKTGQAHPAPDLVEKIKSRAESIANGEAQQTPITPELESVSSDILPESVDSVDDSDEEDSVLWEIFASEANTHLEVVENFISAMNESAPLFTTPSDAMQRALHTLKGSAYMADVKPIAELATPLERFVKELRVYQVDINIDILQLVKDGVANVRLVLAQIENGLEVEIPRLSQYLARIAELKEITVAPLIRQEEAKDSANSQIDPELLSIFMAEEMKLLLDADELIEQWRSSKIRTTELDPLVTELKTLSVGSEHANLPEMSELSDKLCKVYEALSADRLQIDNELYDCLLAGHSELLNMVDAVAVGQNIKPISGGLNQSLNSLLSASDVVSTIPSLGGADGIDFSKIEVVPAPESKLEPEQDLLEGELELAEEDIDLDSLEQDELTFEPNEEVVELTSTYIYDQAKETGSSEIDEQEAADSDLEKTISENAEQITNEFEAPQAETPQEEVFHEEAPQEIEIEFTDFDPVADSEDIQVVDDAYEDLKIQDKEDNTPAEDVVPESSESLSVEKSGANTSAAEDADDDSDEEVDVEILEIFVEEAEELLEEIDEAVHDWEREWSAAEYAEALKRALHTLKGGARLAGIMGLGELAHEFETLVITEGESGNVDESFFAKLHDFQDKLISGTDKVKSTLAGHTPAGLEEVMAASESFDASSLDIPVESLQQELQEDSQDSPEKSLEQSTAGSDESEQSPSNDKPGSSADILPFAPKPKGPPSKELGQSENFTMPAGREAGFTGGGAPSTSPAAARRSGPQEVIKVSAELLEELVNLAGETSISRGRLEEQNSEVVFAIDEMESTVQRLQEQLRRLDIETEAQMIFRQEQMEETEGFDPLEMDRYSQLQQLSRSLMESASDLMDITTTLTDKTRGTETLLLQQSRINTDLQEGLMRSRMVPFSRLVPRLRRIVRQISTELNKRVSFELDNVEGELDRSVLERMIAPLEHMLRNAVDHGIESPEERVKLGKPETGRIILGLSREGGDVLMRLVDDGRGIDLERVKAKAVERGLMDAKAKLSDHDIMQFILHAGFSTADKVTQISGRGVGMDVVHSEIKQLGGAMFINSRWGEGSEFIIRLPFTVSVNRALMIQIGDDNFAIPLNAIEGIVRVSPFELEHYYQDQNARFEYAGENYLVRYLGSMLNKENLPRLEGQSTPMPVVLVRTTEHTMAIQVDRLMGSREIVVKSLGPQFGAVEGLSGATVMGDGNVVVILDPHAMIRKEMAMSAATVQTLGVVPLSPEEDKVQTVMVVDDSVTVRKVTSRFLEREGFEVITAKDGADALQILQEYIPDVMLLDIEMPRMDGFEVAKNIRSTSRLKDIPIIMITSRTGEKHRERALDLGVNKYLGKPYQEEILLSNIQELIGTSTE